MPTSAALDAALGACGRAGKAEEALVRIHTSITGPSLCLIAREA